jgi:hypothetical protein
MSALLRRLALVACVVVPFLGVPGAGTLGAQTAPEPAAPAVTSSVDEKLAKAADDMKSWPRVDQLPDEKRLEAASFVFGNMMYAVFHEMGHAMVSEMQLTVLGREEDAADSFAIVAGTHWMKGMSERALLEAGKAWFFHYLSDKKAGIMDEFYEAHGMNLQRAYQIVCFLYGANPQKYKALADATKLPETRQQTCQDDYALAVWSWDTSLGPHVRNADQPRNTITVVYDEGKGDLAAYAKTFKELQFFERIATLAADKFVWRSPFAMEMQSCNGRVNAAWDVKTRKVTVCYELIGSYVDMYMEFMTDPAIRARMQELKAPAHMR